MATNTHAKTPAEKAEAIKKLDADYARKQAKKKNKAAGKSKTDPYKKKKGNGKVSKEAMDRAFARAKAKRDKAAKAKAAKAKAAKDKSVKDKSVKPPATPQNKDIQDNEEVQKKAEEVRKKVEKDGANKKKGKSAGEQASKPTGLPKKKSEGLPKGKPTGKPTKPTTPAHPSDAYKKSEEAKGVARATKADRLKKENDAMRKTLEGRGIKPADSKSAGTPKPATKTVPKTVPKTELSPQAKKQMAKKQQRSREIKAFNKEQAELRKKAKRDGGGSINGMRARDYLEADRATRDNADAVTGGFKSVGAMERHIEKQKKKAAIVKDRATPGTVAYKADRLDPTAAKYYKRTQDKFKRDAAKKKKHDDVQKRRMQRNGYQVEERRLREDQRGYSNYRKAADSSTDGGKQAQIDYKKSESQKKMDRVKKDNDYRKRRYGDQAIQDPVAPKAVKVDEPVTPLKPWRETPRRDGKPKPTAKPPVKTQDQNTLKGVDTDEQKAMRNRRMA